MTSPHFVIKQNPNSIFAKEFRTHIPVNKLAMRKILESDWDYNYEDSPEWCAMMRIPASTMTACQHLEMLYKQVKNKTTSNLYCKLQQKNIGRAYYQGAISLANLPRNVRQALQIKIEEDEAGELKYEEILFDYDIDNAHPNILLNVCKKAGIPKTEFAKIKKYCSNREKWLMSVKDCFFKNEEDGRALAKRLVLKAFNQGSIDGYLHKMGIEREDVNGTTGLMVLEGIQKEVKNIFKKYFIPANQAFFSDCKVKKSKEIKNGDRHAPFRSFVARTLQHIECEIMEGVLTKLIKLKKIKNKRFDYAFDGFIVPEQLDPKLLNDISKELGWEINWSVKEPSEGIELWEIILDDEEDSKEEMAYSQQDLEFFNDDLFKSYNLNYRKLKDYFEKFYVFVKNPEPMFVYSRYKSFIDGETGKSQKQYVISYRKEEDVRKTYRNIHSRIEITKRGEKKFLFINDYMEDINMVKKEETEFFPQNSNNPKPHHKRYLNTFTGYNDICFEKGIKFDPKSLEKGGILHNFMLVLKNLVGEGSQSGGIEERKIFLYLMAYKIKYPAIKLPFAVLIKGNQGSGKNTVLERFAKIIGEQHYTTTANLKDITGNFAEGMMNKLIVNINEINFADSKSKVDLLKSLISENRMTFDVKYVRPIVQNVYAMLVATTNRPCSMKIDIVSGERRWFIFESNDKNQKLKEIVNKEMKWSRWDTCHKTWQKKEFTQQLYLYLMTLPIEKFNFQQTQYKMANSKAYQKLASYFIPNSALMLKDFLVFGAYLNKSICYIDGLQSDYKCYEDDRFYQSYKIKGKVLHSWYNDWHQDFGGKGEHLNNAKSFINSIMALGCKSINKITMSGNLQGFEFKPFSVVKELNEKKFINVDMADWKQIQDMDNIEEPDDWD